MNVRYPFVYDSIIFSEKWMAFPFLSWKKYKNIKKPSVMSDISKRNLQGWIAADTMHY